MVDPKWESRFGDEHTKLMRDILKYRLRAKILLMRIRRNGPSRNQRLINKRNRENSESRFQTPSQEPSN